MQTPPAIVQPSAFPPAELPSLSALLKAIASIESGDNPNVLGEHGERTRYQIKYSTWVRYTTKAQMFADEREITRVASAHVLWIMAELVKKGYKPHADLIYLVYNTGRWPHPKLDDPKGLGVYTSRVKDRATRVQNLYDEYVRHQ